MENILRRSRENDIYAKKFLIPVIIAIILLSGCSYKTVNYEEVRRQLLGINSFDGINKEEAVILARKYFLDKGYGDRWSIMSPYAYYYAPSKEWFVEFGSKYYFFSEGRYRYTLRVIVTSDGKIRSEAFCRY
jgi:hypothetical protein